MLQTSVLPEPFGSTQAAGVASRSIEGSSHKLLSREAIEQAVVQVFGIGHSDLYRVTRGQAKIALARQVAMYLAHVACGLSLTDTGRLFGRDRTTVAHACGVIEDRRDDPVFDRALDLLEWAVPALATRPSMTQVLSS